jgi:hypothetical protein
MNEWQDNRSGRLGQMAGNIVLRALAADAGRLEREKGTVFAGARGRYICRFSQRAYLGTQHRHWCNLSLAQHEETLATAGRSQQVPYYVFITITAGRRPEIEYWCVPAAQLTGVLGEMPVNSANQICVRIVEEDGVHRIGELDVTPYHRIAPLRRGECRLLERAGREGGPSAVRPAPRHEPGPGGVGDSDRAIIEVWLGSRRYAGVVRRVTDN